jgi:amidase
VPDLEPTLVALTTICASETLAAHAKTFPARASDYGPGFRSFLELGTTVRGQDYANAHMVRERFANHFQSLFDQIDVLACPSMASRSLPANFFPADAGALSSPNPLLRFTGPFNLSRNPTLSQPCGDSSDGPPPSLQLVGRRLGEATLIQTGAAYERATDWHQQHPQAA